MIGEKGSLRADYQRKLWMIGYQSGRCLACGGLFGGQGTAPTYEHVVPRSYGHHKEHNTVLTHAHCNHRRARKPLGACWEFAAEVTWEAWDEVWERNWMMFKIRRWMVTA